MIQFSPSAINEILRLQHRRKDSGSLLRLGIQPKGCMELSYSLEFEQAARDGDQMYTYGTIQVVVDSSSLPYVEDLVVDYSEDLMGGGFRFQNPRAAQSCGCGNSFTVSR